MNSSNTIYQDDEFAIELEMTAEGPEVRINTLRFDSLRERVKYTFKANAKKSDEILVKVVEGILRTSGQSEDSLRMNGEDRYGEIGWSRHGVEDLVDTINQFNILNEDARSYLKSKGIWQKLVSDFDGKLTEFRKIVKTSPILHSAEDRKMKSLGSEIIGILKEDI